MHSAALTWTTNLQNKREFSDFIQPLVSVLTSDWTKLSGQIDFAVLVLFFCQKFLLPGPVSFSPTGLITFDDKKSLDCKWTRGTTDLTSGNISLTSLRLLSVSSLLVVSLLDCQVPVLWASEGKWVLRHTLWTVSCCSQSCYHTGKQSFVIIFLSDLIL